MPSVNLYIWTEAFFQPGYATEAFFQPGGVGSQPSPTLTSWTEAFVQPGYRDRGILSTCLFRAEALDRGIL